MRFCSKKANTQWLACWLLLPFMFEACGGNSTDATNSVETGGTSSSVSGGTSQVSTGGAARTETTEAGGSVATARSTGGNAATGGVHATSQSSGGSAETGGANATSPSVGGNSAAIGGASGTSSKTIASGGVAGSSDNTGGQSSASGGTTASVTGSSMGGTEGNAQTSRSNTASGGVAGTTQNTGGNPSGAGGLSGIGGASGGAANKSAVLTPVIQAFCAAARSCCQAQSITATLTDCESMYASRQPAVASIDSSAVTVDNTVLAACLAAYRSAATACDENAVIHACQDVFVGTKTDGQPCTNAYECNDQQETMACLFVGNSTDPGVCKIMPHGKDGDPCISTCPNGQQCTSSVYGDVDTVLTLCFEADGVYCDNSATTPSCTPLVPLGDSCTSNDACGNANVCDGTCKLRSTLGQACGIGCVPELMCSNGVCTEPPLGNTGVCTGYAPAP